MPRKSAFMIWATCRKFSYVPSRMALSMKCLLVSGFVLLCKGRTLNVDERNCKDTHIDLDAESEPVYLNYDSLTLEEPCVYKFSKSNYLDKICIDAKEFRVTSRQLKVEYHTSIYFSNTAAETYSRDNYPVEEYCDKYSNMFVAFVSPRFDGFDRVRLKIYIKKGKKPFADSSIPSTAIIVGVPLSIMVVILVITIAVIVCLRRSRRNLACNSQRFVYHTVNPNNVTYQPGGHLPQSNQTGGNTYQPTPTHQQGGYNVYPTQVAYPVGQEPASSIQPQPGHQGHHAIDPSAPPPPYPGY